MISSLSIIWSNYIYWFMAYIAQMESKKFEDGLWKSHIMKKFNEKLNGSIGKIKTHTAMLFFLPGW